MTKHLSPLRKTGIKAPDGREFVWGPIQRIHEIGDEYQVVEYLWDASTMAPGSDVGDHGRTFYAPYLNGRSIGRSYYSLDGALVGVIAYKREGPNSRAAEHFNLMTLGTIDDEGGRWQ
jgi:hypothetical protein